MVASWYQVAFAGGSVAWAAGYRPVLVADLAEDLAVALSSLVVEVDLCQAAAGNHDSCRDTERIKQCSKSGAKRSKSKQRCSKSRNKNGRKFLSLPLTSNLWRADFQNAAAASIVSRLAFECTIVVSRRLCATDRRTCPVTSSNCKR